MAQAAPTSSREDRVRALMGKKQADIQAADARYEASMQGAIEGLRGPVPSEPAAPEVESAQFGSTGIYNAISNVVNTVPNAVADVMQTGATMGENFARFAKPGMERLGIIPETDPATFELALKGARAESPATKAIEAVRGATLPTVPGMENTLATKVEKGLGYAAQALAYPPAAVPIGVTEGATGAFVGTYEQAKALGASEEDAFSAALKSGAIGGAANAIKFEKLLSSINSKSGGALAKTIEDALVFGGVGAGQQGLTDVLLEHATDADLPVLANMKEAGIVGGLTGLIVGAATQAMMAKPGPGEGEAKPSSKETLPQDPSMKGSEPNLSTTAESASPSAPESANQPRTEPPARGEDMPPEAVFPESRTPQPQTDTASLQPWERKSRDYARDFADLPGREGDSHWRARAQALRERNHRVQVERAIADGKPVPPEVLSEYPDLVPPPPRGDDTAPDAGLGMFRAPNGVSTADTVPSEVSRVDTTQAADTAPSAELLSQTDTPTAPAKEIGDIPGQGGEQEAVGTGSTRAEPAKSAPLPVPAEMPKGKQIGTDLTGEPVFSKVERGDLKRAPTPESKESQVGMFDEQGGLFEKQAEARDAGTATATQPTRSVSDLIAEAHARRHREVLARSEPGVEYRIPDKFSISTAIHYVESAWSPKMTKKAIRAAIEATGEAGRGKFQVGYSTNAAPSGEGRKEIGYAKFSRAAVDEVFAKLALEQPQSKPKTAPKLEPLKVETVRRELERMAKHEVGQADWGGEAIFAEDAGGRRELVNRSRWVSRSESLGNDWWSDRPGPNQLNAEQVRTAVKKALAGEKLGEMQQRTVDYMVDHIGSRFAREEGLTLEDVHANDRERVAIQNEKRTPQKPGGGFPWESFVNHGVLDWLTPGSSMLRGATKPKAVLPSADGRYHPDPETRIEATIRHVADRFATLRRIEAKAPNPADFSGAETRMHGRAAFKQRQLERDMNRAVEIMRANKITAQDMADFATARHAATRDAVIEARNGTKNGSGMDPKRAAEILAKATPEKRRLMEIHDEVRDRARDLMVESGLISQETADKWKQTFGDTYTPLKTIADPAERFMRGTSKSLQVRGPETKRAEGRGSEADNPFVQMFQDAAEVIARAEKNVVAQEFGKLVDANPSSAWERVDAKETGEDIFTYKVDGAEQKIRVNEPLVLRALKNLDPVVSNQLFRAAIAGSRIMSGFATSRNPEFVLPNFVRDLQTAGANISTEQGTKLAAKVLRSTPKAVYQIGKAMAKPEAAQGYAREYLEAGALTDWIEPQTIDKRLKALDARLKEGGARRGLRELADGLNTVSNAVENGIRFAAYKEARAAGATPEKAAVLAKELTVNWSKKGEWGPFVNSMYLFFSANANGTLRLGQAIKKNPGKAAGVAGAFAASGYLVAMMNDLWGGTDERDGENWWDKQSDSNKRRYAMIQHRDGETTRMPLAPGWGWFYYLGTQAYEAQKNGGKPDVGNLVGSLVDQTVPIGGGSLAQVVSPWFLDPFIQVSENKDFKGDPIYKERMPGDTTPYSSKPDDRTSETSVTIAKLANELTGGTEVRPGKVDIPPRAIDYVSAEGASGLGRFVQRVGQFFKAKVNGQENPWREWPIISRFKGDPPDTTARTYYDNLDRLTIENKARAAGEEADLRLSSAAVNARAKRLRSMIEKAQAAGNKDRARSLMEQFNRLVSD